ncbi:MAG TPA: ribonuclease T2 [Bryobacteraceae bacterium]|nr:ribonuclease T2 [Bryobacteraceae bacterium]
MCAVIAGLLIAGPAAGQRRDEPRGKAGEFDFYVLALSWSPEFCSDARSRNNQEQCGEARRFAFVVHGLWPQYQKGWPQFCPTGAHVQAATIDRTLPIMPSKSLIRHAWEKHGSCSGLAPDRYFSATLRAFNAVRIPAIFRQPLAQITHRPAGIYEAFAKANPDPGEAAFRLQCRGRFLTEMWVCMDKDLKPIACPRSLRDNCRAPEIIARPVR